MSRNRNESNGEETARDAAAGLDHATEKIGGTSDIEEGAKVGYTEENVEARAQETATAEGFTLYRNPDGSHTAIDESATVGYAATGPQRDATDRRHRRDESGTDGLDQRDVVRILRDAKYVMLTTALADGKLLAHPMVPQQVTDDADVWFFIGLDGDQAGALRQNPHVNIAVSEAGNWLSVAGMVEFVDSRAKIDYLWNDDAATWFEGGKEDPNLGLLHVVTDSAQHWGLKGGKVAGLAQMIKAKVTGQRPEGGSQTTEL
ncbi:pyridoxamine 5'-phosphate oxidase family protein [Brevibacterium casei]|uniref:pyridoxamine 5'-phosphate oxidase family protein n=1 Tax=Brevibacterium casei TaxID=33889 RepID=UPI0028AD248F|nr:pyridoxamine 5'-phosphate oxidase family protein [Brevibacterium casei]